MLDITAIDYIRLMLCTFKIMEQKWYKARLIQYVIYGTLYLAISKLVSFEFAVICALGTIIGEMHHKE